MHQPFCSFGQIIPFLIVDIEIRRDDVDLLPEALENGRFGTSFKRDSATCITRMGCSSLVEHTAGESDYSGCRTCQVAAYEMGIELKSILG